MDKIKPLFPLSWACTDTDSLIKNLVIYIVAAVVLSLIGVLVGWIPVVGWIIGIIFWVCDVYIAIGIILAILVFFNIVK